MFEQNYQSILSKFLNQQSTVDEFVNAFIMRWKTDRDVSERDIKFRRMIDRIFTSCDCYYPEPAPLSAIEISEEKLRNEVDLLYYIWWGQEPGLQSARKIK